MSKKICICLLKNCLHACSFAFASGAFCCYECPALCIMLIRTKVIYMMPGSDAMVYLEVGSFFNVMEITLVEN